MCLFASVLTLRILFARFFDARFLYQALAKGAIKSKQSG
jgi:hypothetical protein